MDDIAAASQNLSVLVKVGFMTKAHSASAEEESLKLVEDFVVSSPTRWVPWGRIAEHRP